MVNLVVPLLEIPTDDGCKFPNGSMLRLVAFTGRCNVVDFKSDLFHRPSDVGGASRFTHTSSLFQIRTMKEPAASTLYALNP